VRRRSLELWFEYGSLYAYLTVARVDTVARARGVDVSWRPFLLTPILVEQGIQPIHPIKFQYMWHDLERRARRHGIPYKKPSVYPPKPLLTARIGCLAQKEGWCAEFTKEVFRLHWTEDLIIGTDENITRSLRSVGKDADRVVPMAQTDENKLALRLQTEQAKSLGIFGSPSFVVGKELFWGDDRLEDAVDFAFLLVQ
jgi:2-hydroxychromene-2-carboxylate isomerase